MVNERRKFIKDLSIISICFNINPLSLFSRNGIEIDNEVLKIFNETNIHVDSAIGQLNNYCILSSLAEVDLKAEYIGLLNILLQSLDPNNRNLSDDDKYQVLKLAQENPNFTKQQVKELYKAFIVTGLVGIGTMYVTKGKLGILLASTGTILSVPSWIKTGSKIVDGVVNIYKGGRMINDALTNNVIYSAEITKNSVYGKFMNLDSDRLKFELPNLKVNISSNITSDGDILNSNNLMDPVSAGFVSWIKNEIGDKNIFSSKEEFEFFLERYIIKVGEIQEASLRKIFDAEKENNIKKALEERDSSALCNSIHNTMGIIISNFVAPKEAEILNTLIAAGFQYAMIGMTPIGWAAVGINIANTLFSKSSNNGFEKALLKALQQIQEQLTFIIEQIEVLQKNQIEILIQLNEILSKINNLEDIVIFEFQDISKKMDIIYNTILVTERDTLENEYLFVERLLLDSYNNQKWNDFYSNLQKLSNIGLNKLDDNIITKYDKGSFRADYLKNQVFFEQKYKINISLYDSIGLISAFYNYNPYNDRGLIDFKPIHPLEFNKIVDSMVGWLIVSELSVSEKVGLADSLLKAAEFNSENLKRISEQKVINEKAILYEKISVPLLSSLYDLLKNKEKSITTDKVNLVNKFNLLTANDVKLDDFIDDNIKNVNISSNFIDNKNDNKLFNLAKDLDLFKEITTISKNDPIMQIKTRNEFRSSRPRNINDHFPNFSIGDSNAVKNNRIIFNNVLLDYSKNLYITFELLYTGKLIITGVNDINTDVRGCGHDGNNDCFRVLRVVTSTKAEFNFNSSWKKVVSDKCLEKGSNIKEVFIDFENLSFDSFLKHLINQSFWLLKFNLISEADKYINKPSFSKFDGIGISLMVLSKLNELITSDNPLPYIIDYSDEFFIREDIINSLYSILHIDINNDGSKLFDKILNDNLVDNFNDKPNSIYYIKNNSGNFDKLNPEKFVDFCMILLKEKILNTIRKSIEKTNIIEHRHVEPFIEKSIMKLKWYLESQV